ncbi:MAG: Fur family transcriptional regulator [Bacillota bacterium]
MRDLIREARSKLRDENYRPTRQREVIFELLARQPRVHFTAQEIHDAAREKHQLGLSTVYRTLSVLEEVGLIRKLDVGDGVARYEFDGEESSPHCHLVCLGCGTVMETSCPAPEEMQSLLQTDGFEICDQSLLFFGFCTSCAERHSAGTRDSPATVTAER